MKVKVMARLAAGLAILAVGCGEAQRLTKAEFVKQANAICVRREAQIQRAQESTENKTLSMRRGWAVVGKRTQDLAALKPPAALKRTFDDFVAADHAMYVLEQRNLSGHARVVIPPQASIRHRAQLMAKLGWTDCP